MGDREFSQPVGALDQILIDATELDLEFAEQPMSTHALTGDTKVGYRPIAVRGVAIANPNLIVYVRARDASGEYWYVIDWSQAESSGKPQETVVTSEQEARSGVLAGLRRLAGRIV
jgi:hypothetical protein